MSGYFIVDEVDWPHVRVRVNDVEVTDADLLASVTSLGAIAKRGERYTLLIDARGARPLGARQRQILAEASRATEAEATRNCAASAIIVSNAIMRGVMTALHWLKPTGYPERSFTDIGEAEAWVRELHRAG